MSYVGKESLTAQYRITTTRKPPRGLDAEKAARRQLQPGETAHSHFATVGERGIIDEIRNASAADIRADMEVQRHAPAMTCIECGHPDFLHDPRGELVATPVHRPVYRTPGVTPGTERYDENDPNSPNRVARRPEIGQFMLAVDETDPEYQAAALRWNRAVARHRPDPTHPANWPEVD